MEEDRPRLTWDLGHGICSLAGILTWDLGHGICSLAGILTWDLGHGICSLAGILTWEPLNLNQLSDIRMLVKSLLRIMSRTAALEPIFPCGIPCFSNSTDVIC